MKNTFKKSLLAVAVAGVSTLAIAEADLANNTTLRAVSTDGQLGASQASNTVSVELGAEYTQGDIIKLTFDGASLDTNSIAQPTGGDLSLGILESSETGVTYRVTQTVPNTTTSGDVVSFGSFKFDSDELATAGAVSVKYSAETSTGVSLDSGKTNSANLIVAAPQLAALVQKSGRLSKTANISADRFLFTDGSASDTLTFTIGGASGVDLDGDNVNDVSFDAATLATIDEAEYTVSGDFSWVADTNENVEGIQADSDTFTVTCGAGSLKANSLTVEADQVSFVCEGMALQTGYAMPSLAIDLKQGESATYALNPIPTTDFEATIDYKLSNSDDDNRTATSYAGAWDLNAAEASVNYMPYGPNISQIIYVTNSSSKAGAITVNVYDEDGEALAEGVAAGTAVAGGVTQIAGAIKDAIGEYQGKARIEVTVDAPSTGITVYSAYNVGGSDRGFVSNN